MARQAQTIAAGAAGEPRWGSALLYLKKYVKIAIQIDTINEQLAIQSCTEDCAASCPTQYEVNGFRSLRFDSCWHFVFIQRKHWSPADVDMGIRSCNFRTNPKNSGTHGPCNKEMDVFFTRWFLEMHWDWWWMHRGRFIPEPCQLNQKPFKSAQLSNSVWCEFLTTQNAWWIGIRIASCYC